MTRTWGAWTEVKLDALSSYLTAFNIASKRARGTLYLDLFAGAGENRSREDGSRIAGSVERAISTQPPFSRIVACEMRPRAVRELRKIAEQDPSRDVVILEGDCNEQIPPYLAALARREPGWQYAPTFAFLDQFSAEVRWSTIQALANFRKPTRNGHRKAELWMYFGESFIPRAVGLPDFVERVDAMFGNCRWRELWEGRTRGLLTPFQFKAELVNLMRWQLQEDLGYKTTLPLAIRNTHNRDLYTMIFATDTDVGDRIMRSVFKGAEADLAAMNERAKARRREEREESAGIYGLFSSVPERGWRPENVEVSPLDPPQPPWRLPRD